VAPVTLEDEFVIKMNEYSKVSKRGNATGIAEFAN